MRISTKGHYAVQAIVDIAMKGGGAPVSLGLIAQRQELSQNYLEQLFVKLRKADLVRSVRGPGGGYMLARGPSQITIGQIFAAVDESLTLIECAGETAAGEEGFCSRADDCVTQALWSKLCQHFNSLLFSITINDVIRGEIELPAPAGSGHP
ncbi:MAG: Rrf2 family transcriptional regulator [Candidatus Nitrospinota bacterium M3_3B_026]